MTESPSRRLHGSACLGALALALLGGYVAPAAAQSAPPLIAPVGGPPGDDPATVTFAGWQLRGGVDVIAEYSNNYLLTAPPDLVGPAVGVSPHLAAIWSNGIRTTAINLTYTNLRYQSFDTNDGEATVTESYSPLRGLTISATADYLHQTIAPTLTNSIAQPVAAVATPTTVLSNGDTVLADGTIVSPTGQIVGKTSAISAGGGVQIYNPYDQYTASVRAEKIFNQGVVSVSASLLRATYEEPYSTENDYASASFTEDSAFWLGPMFYAYSDASYGARNNNFPYPASSAYRVVGGVGTGAVGHLRGSIYAGYQGSQSQGEGSGGGIAYGGSISYDPSARWSLGLNFDETDNAVDQTYSSNQALSLPNPTAAQLALGQSEDISALTFRMQYRSGDRWDLTGALGYTDVRFPDGQSPQNSWLVDATLHYALFHNLDLTLEYQFACILAGTSATNAYRQLGVLTTSYKF